MGVVADLLVDVNDGFVDDFRDGFADMLFPID